MWQQLGFVADENRVLLLALIETHDGFRDLAHQVAPVVCRNQVQFQRQLPQQVESRSTGPVQVQHLIEIGIEAGSEGARRGGFAGAYFAGEQTGAVMIDQELEPRTSPASRTAKQTTAWHRGCRRRWFLETEESFYHGTESLLVVLLVVEQLDEVNAGRFGRSRWIWFQRRQQAIDDGIDQACHALRSPWKYISTEAVSSGSKRTSTVSPASCGRGFVVAILQQEGAVAAHQAS